MELLIKYRSLADQLNANQKKQFLIKFIEQSDNNSDMIISSLFSQFAKLLLEYGPFDTNKIHNIIEIISNIITSSKSSLQKPDIPQNKPIKPLNMNANDIKNETKLIIKSMKPLNLQLFQFTSFSDSLFKCIAAEIYNNVNKYIKVKQEYNEYIMNNNRYFKDIDNEETRIEALTELYNIRIKLYHYHKIKKKLCVLTVKGEYDDNTLNLPLISILKRVPIPDHYDLIIDLKSKYKSPLTQYNTNDLCSKSLRDYRLTIHGIKIDSLPAPLIANIASFMVWQIDYFPFQNINRKIFIACREYGGLITLGIYSEKKMFPSNIFKFIEQLDINWRTLFYFFIPFCSKHHIKLINLKKLTLRVDGFDHDGTDIDSIYADYFKVKHLAIVWYHGSDDDDDDDDDDDEWNNCEFVKFLCKFSNLEYLKLCDIYFKHKVTNNIDDITNAFKKLKALYIDGIPEELAQKLMKSYQHQIESIYIGPDQQQHYIASLSKLKELSVSSNAIKRVNEVIMNINKLQLLFVDLSEHKKNVITNFMINVFTKEPHLSYFDVAIDCNQFNELIVALGNGLSSILNKKKSMLKIACRFKYFDVNEFDKHYISIMRNVNWNEIVHLIMENIVFKLELSQTKDFMISINFVNMKQKKITKHYTKIVKALDVFNDKYLIQCLTTGYGIRFIISNQGNKICGYLPHGSYTYMECSV